MVPMPPCRVLAGWEALGQELSHWDRSCAQPGRGATLQCPFPLPGTGPAQECLRR